MSNLYSLIHVSDLGVKKVIPFKYEKGVTRKKIALTTIDAYTTNFLSKDYLRDDLNSRGFNLINGEFKITYISKKRTRNLDVAYSNQEKIKHLSSKNIDKYIVEKDKEFTEYFFYVIGTFKLEPKLYEYLRDYHYISPTFATDVKQYIYYYEVGNNNDEYYQLTISINRYLSKYKNIRAIEMGISKYRQRGEITVESTSFVKKKKTPEQLKLF